MTTAMREAWAVAEQFTPMFRIRFEAERGATGPDEQELQGWLQATLVYRHTTEDAGMFATWLVREYEAAYPGPYDCVVTYRASYHEKRTNGVRIRRKG